MSITVWVWFAAAVVLFVTEILSPSLFVLPFAVGALCAALAAAARASAGWQWIVFVGVSGLLTVVLQRLVVGRRKR